MGEARRRAASAGARIYHHTASLWAHLLWMSGEIAREGRGPEVSNPAAGSIRVERNDGLGMKLPLPLVWFSESRDVPKCLLEGVRVITHRAGEDRHDMVVSSKTLRMLTFRQIAIEFDPAAIQAIRWTEHVFATTAAGKALTNHARDLGDDPGLWWVCESPVDLMRATGLLLARGFDDLRMRRSDESFAEMRRMVQFCRENPGTQVAPAWLKPDDAKSWATKAAPGQKAIFV